MWRSATRPRANDVAPLTVGGEVTRARSPLGKSREVAARDLLQQLSLCRYCERPRLVGDLDESAGTTDDRIRVIALERPAVDAADAASRPTDRQGIDREPFGERVRSGERDRRPAYIGSVPRDVDDLAGALEGVGLHETDAKIDCGRNRIVAMGHAGRLPQLR